MPSSASHSPFACRSKSSYSAVNWPAAAPDQSAPNSGESCARRCWCSLRTCEHARCVLPPSPSSWAGVTVRLGIWFPLVVWRHDACVAAGRRDVDL